MARSADYPKRIFARPEILLGGERTRGHLRWRKRAVVLQRGDHAACLRYPSRIDSRGDDPGFLAAIGQHLAPRVDNQRVAVALAAGSVLAPLRRREHEAAILDCPGAQQHMPM